MALFRRKQTTTEIPELKEYYEAQKTENPAKAWLLAIISLLLTIGVVLALFFGGRWLYRTLFDDDKPSTGTSQTANQDNETRGESEADHEETGDAPGHVDNQPNTSVNPTPLGDNDRTEQDDQTAGSTPATGSDTEALPSTGPSDVLAIFFVTVLIGYIARNTYTARKSR